MLGGTSRSTARRAVRPVRGLRTPRASAAWRRCIARRSAGRPASSARVALKRMLAHLAEDRGVRRVVRARGEGRLAARRTRTSRRSTTSGASAASTTSRWSSSPGFDLRKLLRYANRANEPIPLPVVLVDPRRAVRRARLRAHVRRRARPAARHRPPRRLAVEPDRRAHRPPQGDRLRHREGVSAASSTPRAGRSRASSATCRPRRRSGVSVGAGLRRVLRWASSRGSSSPRRRCSPRAPTSRRCARSARPRSRRRRATTRTARPSSIGSCSPRSSAHRRTGSPRPPASARASI